ncbi:synaptonemal complex protein 3-like [Gigantopelta aegis]|uniref:synaptonemal complex protein 3-like n=1 Tax=Gigantopelta aegis TaxID=1735272 RepID=UPI001B888B86|nr:synaptonemal complex protein 3-like [Gigantopelta aegis]
MPKVKKGSDSENAAVIQKKGFDDRISDSPRSLNSSPFREDETPIISRAGKKRPAECDEDFGNEMQKMLECFGADISKTLVSKRKRLEQITQSTLKNSNKKVEDVWREQQNERRKLHEEYSRQVCTVFTQWEADIEKTKDQEEKLTSLFKQQQKLIQQARIVQSQRLKTIRQLHEQLSKGVDELDKCHTSQQNNVQIELKKEMALLQKKILMDTQQQEMANVRKSLQTMLF